METKTTRETYFKICEQLGKEPDEDKIPPEMEDFPLDVQLAIETFGKLGDKIVPDVGYMGKDFTSLPIHLQILDVQNETLFMETLLRLDEKIIKKSSEEMKRARDKLKRK